MDGWTDVLTYIQMDERVGGWIDGWMGWLMDELTCG